MSYLIRNVSLTNSELKVKKQYDTDDDSADNHRSVLALNEGAEPILRGRSNSVR